MERRMTIVLRYQKVKDFILSHIEDGKWLPGHKIPSESTLVKELKTSRMTVNRAIRELAATGLLERMAGAGTFVAARRKQADFLAIKDISEQIRDMEKSHSSVVKVLEKVSATADLARYFDLATGTELFHTIILHFADNEPVQIEDRYVNPAIDPGFLSVDFSKTTPSEHLQQTAPLNEVEHAVQAIMPGGTTRKLLGIDSKTPCLQLTRRTWTGDQVATYARFLHPGPLFKIGSRFSYRREHQLKLAKTV
jgi:GntR family transcriptional regulator, histidine utilization repressor